MLCFRIPVYSIHTSYTYNACSGILFLLLLPQLAQIGPERAVPAPIYSDGLRGKGCIVPP